MSSRVGVACSSPPRQAPRLHLVNNLRGFTETPTELRHNISKRVFEYGRATRTASWYLVPEILALMLDIANYGHGQVYNWDPYKDVCYDLYIKEGKVGSSLSPRRGDIC